MLELAHRAGRPDLESLALTQLASVAGVQGDVARSLVLLDRAEARAETSGSREATAYALAVHGRRFDEGESDEAERHLQKALDLFEEIGAAGRYGWTLSNLASVYRQRGDVALAEKTFREAVRRLRRTHEQGYLVEADGGWPRHLSSGAKSTRLTVSSPRLSAA
jgi:tetratricopeptide (TPR) repeat protein